MCMLLHADSKCIIVILLRSFGEMRDAWLVVRNEELLLGSSWRDDGKEKVRGKGKKKDSSRGIGLVWLRTPVVRTFLWEGWNNYTKSKNPSRPLIYLASRSFKYDIGWYLVFYCSQPVKAMSGVLKAESEFYRLAVIVITRQLGSASARSVKTCLIRIVSAQELGQISLRSQKPEFHIREAQIWS